MFLQHAAYVCTTENMRKADNVSTLEQEETIIYKLYNTYILCSAEIQPLRPFFSKVKNPVVEVRITFLF